MTNLSSTAQLCIKAKAAVKKIALLDDERINGALIAMADAIVGATGEILLANEQDVVAASGVTNVGAIYGHSDQTVAADANTDATVA